MAVGLGGGDGQDLLVVRPGGLAFHHVEEGGAQVQPHLLTPFSPPSSPACFLAGGLHEGCDQSLALSSRPRPAPAL